MSRESIFLVILLLLSPTFLYGQENPAFWKDQTPLIAAAGQVYADPEEGSETLPAWLQRSGGSSRTREIPPRNIPTRPERGDLDAGASENVPAWLQRSGASSRTNEIPPRDIPARPERDDLETENATENVPAWKRQSGSSRTQSERALPPVREDYGRPRFGEGEQVGPGVIVTDGGQPKGAGSEALDTQRDAELTGDGLDAKPKKRGAGGGGEGQGAVTAPTEPTRGGKTLGEWMRLLSDNKLDTRIEAAKALGVMGRQAEEAIGPLNRARLWDGHESMQRYAALAMCKIMGVALGDIQPRPREGGRGGGGDEEAGPVPEGRIYYLYGIHEVSEDGAQVIPGLERRSNNFTNYPFGFTNENFNYLDLAEAYRYRQDAKSRGLDVSQRLFDLIRSDPKIEEVMKTFKMFRSYKNDYIVRITCNQQTLYAYWRRLAEGGWEMHGGGPHRGMTPGKYTAKVAIWTKDGFRVNFDIPFNHVVDLEDGAEKWEKVSGPQDLAKEARENLAGVPRVRVRNERQRNDVQARALRYVVEDMLHEIPNVLLAQPLMPQDALPYLRDVFSMIQRSEAIDPVRDIVNTTPVELLADIVGNCASSITEESFGIARQATRMVEGLLSDPRIRPYERALGVAHYWRFGCYKNLARMAITYNMDINAFLKYSALAHQSEEKIIAPWDHSGGKTKPVLMAKLRPKWPEAGWWNPSWDELQPPEPAELPGGEGDGEGKGEGDGEGELKDAGSDWVKKRLNELMAEYDAQQAWLVSCTRGGMKLAFDRTQEAWQKLQVLRVAAEEKIKRIAGLYAKLAPLPETRSDDYLEDAFQAKLRLNPNFELKDLIPEGDPLIHFQKLAFETTKEIFKALGEEPPKSEQEAAQAFIEMIGKEQKKLIRIRQDQRKIIDRALEAYQNIDNELDARGLRDKAEKRWVEKDIAAHKQLLKKRVELAKLQMYCAAGMDEEFDGSARALIDRGEDQSMVRFFQGVHALQKGKRRVALTALRYAFDLRAKELHPDQPWWQPAPEEPEKITVGPEKEVKIDPIAASIKTMIQELELGYVRAIGDKTMADSDMVRERCKAELSKHGDPGLVGYIKDLLTSGVYTSVSAIGDKLGQYKHLTEAIPRAFTDATEADKVERLGGLHEVLAERQGVILNEARLQQIGLALIARLRQAGMSLQEIDKLDTQGFIDATRKHFHLKGDAADAEPGKGWTIDAATAKRMLLTIKLAGKNPDMSRLVKWSGQPLDVETGKSYYKLEEFDTSLKVNIPIVDVDVDIADTMNVWNVFVFLGPNALVDKGGKGFFDFARPTPGAAAKDVMTLKEAVATQAGLPKIAQALGKLEGGGDLMRDFLTFYNRSGFVGRWGADGLVTWYASEGGRLLGRVASTMAGGTQEDQAWWGRVIGEVATMLTTFGLGDVDVGRKMAQIGVKAATRQALATAGKSLGKSIATAEETAQLLEGFTRRLDGIMDKLGSGKMSQADVKALREAMNSLKEDVLSARAKIKAGDAGPEMRTRTAVLEQTYSAMEATSFGQPEMGAQLTKTVKEAQEGIMEQVGQLKTRQASVSKLRSMAEASSGDTVSGPPKGSDSAEFADAAGGAVGKQAADLQLDYSGKFFADADELMMQNRFRAAARAYEEWLAYMGGRGVQGSAMWREATEKLAKARLAAKGQARWFLDTAGAAPTGAKAYARDFSPEELKRLSESPDVVMVPVGKGMSDPMFLCEKVKVGMLKDGKLAGEAFSLRPVAVWKPDTGGLAGEAEDFFSWLSREAGLKAPATARGDLAFVGRKAKLKVGWIDMDGPPKKGTFIRYAPGADWGEVMGNDPAMALALKKAYGEDLAFSAFISDHDRHMLNHRMISADEHIHMDRNMGKLMEDMNNPLDPNVPATPEQLAEIKTLMLHRLKATWKFAGTPDGGLYRPTAWLQRYVGMADCRPTFKKIDAISPQAMRARLDRYAGLTKAQKDQIVAQLIAKRSILPEVMEEFLDWAKKNTPAPKNWAVPSTKPVMIMPPPKIRSEAVPMLKAA